jgi:hypothetical protein
MAATLAVSSVSGRAAICIRQRVKYCMGAFGDT